MQKCDTIESLFNGTRVSFPLTITGTPLTTTAVNLMVSYNGVMQEPLVDYTISTTDIVFAVAPVATRKCFIISAT